MALHPKVNMDKTTNHNQEPNELSTNQSWNEYLNLLSHKMEPANNDYFKRLALELTEWARKNKKAMMISQFYALRGIPESTYFMWVKDNQILKDAHEFATLLIANRREEKLIEKDPSSLKFTMPHYSKIWRQESERRAALAAKNTTELTVNYEAQPQVLPHSAMVPNRKKLMEKD